MTLTKKIKMLCDEKGLTFAELERKVGISNGQIRRWDSSSPKIENVQKIADYFNVSTDYLLGRTEKKYWELNEKDEKYIQDKLQEFIKDISNADALAFSKDAPLSEADRELLIISMENTLRLGKEMAKKKFTPKKYRSEDE